MAGPDLPSTYMTEEQLIAELRRQYAAEQPLAAYRPILMKVGTAAAIVALLGVAALGTTGNVAYANDQSLRAARDTYDAALATLDQVYETTRDASTQLETAISDGSDLVATAAELSEAVNGFVDPDALASLASATRALAHSVTAPAAAAVRGPLKPTTTDEYRAAVGLVLDQTERDRDALATTRAAIAAIHRDSVATEGGVHQVAATVAVIAPQIIQANRHALPATRDECFTAVAGVQAALGSGGDVTPALHTYAAAAHAVLESAINRTGQPAVQVVATVPLPDVPPAVAAIAQRRPADPSDAKTGTAASATPAAPVAPPTSPAPPAEAAAPVTPAPGGAPSSAHAVPEAFALVFHTDGPYQPGCKHSVVVGGGIAYGAVGTTKTQALVFGFPYTYELTTTSRTTVSWIVYACKSNK